MNPLLVFSFLAIATPHQSGFVLGSDCTLDPDEPSWSLNFQHADSSAAWGACTLHAFGAEILGMRCVPVEASDTITVSIVDAGGHAVRVLELEAGRSVQVRVWDGKDSNGRIVDEGGYLARFASRKGVIEIPFCKRPVDGPLPTLRRSIDSPIEAPSKPISG